MSEDILDYEMNFGGAKNGKVGRVEDKPRSFDPNAVSKEEQQIGEEAIKAKYAMLRRMWERLDKPCSNYKDIEKAMLVAGSRGEIYIWDQNAEKYEYWNAKDDLWAALQAFAPDFHAGTRWPTKQSIYIQRNFMFRAKKIDFHMKGYDNRIDFENHTAWISTLHKSKYTPVYHEDVNYWLRVFGGKSSDRLLDWLASFTRLDRSTCMLYICGPKGIGKNLLAESLGQIWGGFADWEDRASDYQSDMGRNPYIWANEDMEKPRRTSIMAAIRRVIGGGSQRINEKQRPAYGMEAYYRLLVTANNSKLLKSWANLSDDDVEAVRERVGYFYACAGAKDALAKLAQDRNITVNELTTEFSSYKVAEHVLWLAQNRKLKNEGNQRLLVEGWSSDVTDALEYETQEAFLFANAFHSCQQTSIHSSIKNIDGEYWINFNNLVNEWEEISFKRTDQIRWKEMRDFVKMLSTNEKKRIRVGGSHSNAVYFHKLDSGRLRKLLSNYGFETEEVDSIVEVKSDVVDLESIKQDVLAKKAEELARIEAEKIDILIARMPDSIEKNVVVVMNSLDEFKTDEELLTCSIDVLNKIGPVVDLSSIDKKQAHKIKGRLKKAYCDKNYDRVAELFEELIDDKQVGLNRQDEVYRSQGSIDRSGQYDEGFDL